MKTEQLRELKITITTAERWYNGTDAELKEMALTAFPELSKPKLPEKWEDCKPYVGFCVNNGDLISRHTVVRFSVTNKNVFKTKAQAQASIAFSMYSVLIDEYIKANSIESFIKIAKEYEPKLRPLLSLIFGEELAESGFYYGLLAQLRDVYRDGWKPDFRNENEKKHCIIIDKNNIFKDYFTTYNFPISFQTPEIRDLFLQNFKELIEKAKPLMS